MFINLRGLQISGPTQGSDCQDLVKLEAQKNEKDYLEQLNLGMSGVTSMPAQPFLPRGERGLRGLRRQAEGVMTSRQQTVAHEFITVLA